MKESLFTSKCAKSWESVGAIVVPNVMGMKVSHVPDRTVIWNFGMWYIEFKGPQTRIKPGQKIFMERVNKVMPCALVLRYPDLIQLPNGKTLMEAPCPIDPPRPFLCAFQSCLLELACI